MEKACEEGKRGEGGGDGGDANNAVKGRDIARVAVVVVVLLLARDGSKIGSDFLGYLLLQASAPPVLDMRHYLCTNLGV